MEFAIPKIVAYIAAWFGILAGIWALFERAEIVLREDVRKKLSNWLKNDTDLNSQDWASLFISIFDRFFFTSIFLVKLFTIFNYGLKLSWSIMVIDNKPLRSIGFVSMLLTTIVFLILPFT